MKAPLPPNEEERLKALRRYEILDTVSEQEFDDIALLASRICETPIAMISLVDENRQWFKSKVGMTESETSRDISFCAHGILQADVFVVKDAQADERFASNPMVTDHPRIRFYAGAPLITSDGQTLGMLCVKDQAPRDLSPEQKTALLALSRQVVAQLELRRSLTELRQTVAQLKRAEESLRLLSSAVEQSRESILITDAELDLPGPRIVFVNPAYTKMTGYTAEEIIGETPRILQGPRTDKAVMKRLRQNLERGESFAGETINYRKDGKEFNLEWQIAPIRDSSGKTTHFVAIQRDITERKRLESQLFQAQKLETVGRLAGGIAHEFNTILTTVIGHAEMIGQGVSSGSPEFQSADQIGKSAGRAAQLTQQLLAFSRKQMLQPEILDLNAAVAHAELMLRPLLGDRIELRVATQARHPWAKADAGQIQQMLVQLAANAQDAMPHGGKLTLETADVTLDESYVSSRPGVAAGEYVMLAIADTGAGISDEVKPRLFEPFFTTKPLGEGTGLGLSMCYGIVKQLGGDISVHSEPGRGSIFKVYLPRVSAIPSEPAAAPEPIRKEMTWRGSETILLVEDDAGLRDLAALVLGKLGYTVHAAANGCEAMSIAGHTTGIDLLLTDAVMPQMSGKELADQLRLLQPCVKVLFTSAYTEEAIVHHGILDPGADYLHKPYTPLLLSRKTRGALDRN
jgi:two-component system cell cycle sensor histidine kinase/response regulator CckA